MNYDGLPQHVLVKLVSLDEAVAALKAGTDAVERGIEDRRARLYGNARGADDNPRALQAELERLLADQKVMQQRVQAEQSVLSACKAWLDRLPEDTKLEPVGHAMSSARRTSSTSSGATSRPSVRAAAFAHLQHSIGIASMLVVQRLQR
jgi:hypothetical protein